MIFSYVIPYRSDEGRRAANLRAVLDWVSSRLPAVELVLVEQDREPRATSRPLPPNCKHVFTFNEGPFNRSWGFNVGFQSCTGEVIGFGDADLFMGSRPLMHCFECCHVEFDAVKPYDQLVDLTPDESLLVLDGNFDISVERPEAKPNREGIGEYTSFCGGLFLIRRGVYAQLGGFDERFRGWGGEDDAMTMKLSKLVPNTGTARNTVAYHLFHERGNPYLQPHYRDNVAIVNEYTQMDVDSLRRLCIEQRKIMGNIGKYCFRAS